MQVLIFHNNGWLTAAKKKAIFTFGQNLSNTSRAFQITPVSNFRNHNATLYPRYFQIFAA